MLRNVIAVVIAVAVGALGYSLWMRKDAEESPINVMVTQMRTRAIIEHERQVMTINNLMIEVCINQGHQPAGHGHLAGQAQ